MTSHDLLVIFAYVAGLIFIGSIFARKMKDSREMFAAGGRSPWWLSGLSGFMTMFSAGTFVVWGGISYRYGLVGTAICMTLGISALLVGWFLAGVWKKQGVDSAAEFLELRFGRSIVQFYIWLHGVFGIFTMGGSIYALSVIVCALVPLPAGHLLVDPATGNLSVTFTSVVICFTVVGICFMGGLWAVLMTDVLQFIVLTTAVLLVVPMLLGKVGGVGGFIEKTPEGFLHLTHGEFTWWFLAGWTLVHFFKIGGEWAYIQRFTCVPSPRDARKAAWIFGVMYLVSPLFWMLPPMIYRVIDASAPHEQAYILACRHVLPAGLMGLMVAAMSSATASTATTILNVYAGAFTNGFYREFFRPDASDREMVLAGRVTTILLGGLVLAGALLIPRMGGYTGWILATTALLTGPMVLPTIWGLFSRKIGLATAWWVTLSSATLGIIVKFGCAESGWFDGVAWLEGLNQLARVNPRMTDIVLGTAVPLAMLLIIELSLKSTSKGWDRVAARRAAFTEGPPVQASPLPARLCGWSILCLAALLAKLAFLHESSRGILLGFAAALGGIAGVTLWLTREKKHPAP